MGALGAIILGFFGAVFAAMTLVWRLRLAPVTLTGPFVIFVVIVMTAVRILRAPGQGVAPTPREGRALRWSSIGEGVGIFIAANVVINLHRPDLLLPAIALVVGLHFLPIAVAGFRPFYMLGAALIVAALAGVLIVPPAGGALSGGAAAVILWAASAMALRRDALARAATAGA